MEVERWIYRQERGAANSIQQTTVTILQLSRDNVIHYILDLPLPSLCLVLSLSFVLYVLTLTHNRQKSSKISLGLIKFLIDSDNVYLYTQKVTSLIGVVDCYSWSIKMWHVILIY